MDERKRGALGAAGSLDDGQTKGVPFIQSADINDGDIIDKTMSYKGESFDPPSPGKMFFQITLPSGQLFSCTPFDPVDRKNMTIAWLEHVKAAWIADAAAAADAVEPKSNLGAQLLAEVADTPEPAPRKVANPIFAQAPAPTEPREFAKHQLTQAMARFADAQNETAAAQIKAQAAEAAIKQWTTILNSFGAS